MKKNSLFVTLCVLLCACSKDDLPAPNTIPDTGMYVEMEFDASEITVHENIEYSQRPNYMNLQYTSDKTKATEIEQETLSLKLDVLSPPKLTALQPLLVMIHGGGFTAGDKDAWNAEAITYARAGYVCATINYRLTKQGAEPPPELRQMAVEHALEDIQNAIRYLKMNANSIHVDTSRMVVFGGSAGGVLALLNAVEFDIAVGVNDFPAYSSKTKGSISTGASLINDDPGNQPDMVHYDSNDSPVLLFHAKEYDSGDNGFTWTENAVPTQNAINDSGNTCTLVAQPNMTHTVSLDLGGEYWEYLKPFLWEHLRLAEL